MKETRTAKGSGCPTWMHYLARVLLRTDPTLILFTEEMPSVEAAARSVHPGTIVNYCCSYRFYFSLDCGSFGCVDGVKHSLAVVRNRARLSFYPT